MKLLGRGTEHEEVDRVSPDEQAALRRITMLAAGGVAPAEVAAAVAREISTVMGVRLTNIFRFEPNGTATVAASHGAGNPFEIGLNIPLEGDSVTAQIFRTGLPARMSGYSGAAGSIAALSRQAGTKAAVGAPIRIEDRLWGAAVATWTDAMPDDAEARLANFADLVGVAIANAESREALSQLAEEQAALRRVATLVARESSPMEIFHSVTEEAWRVLGSEAVGMLRFEPDGTATLVAQSETPWDPPPLGTRFTLDGENVVTKVHRTGRAARADDWTDATGAVAAMADVLGVRSAVATPIVAEGRVWGLLIAATNGSDPLPVDTESRIGQFTELVATAIANAEAHSDVVRLADEQAALRRVATLVAENPDSEELFSAVAREVAGVLDVRGVIVDRFEADGSQITLGSAYDLELEGAESFLGVGVRLPFHPGTLAAGVWETHRAARVDDYSKLEGGMGDAARAAGVGSGCAAPIMVDGRLWGQMCVFSGEGTELPVGLEDRLDDFVKLLATAISNYDARSSLHELADEQAALRRVATLVAQSAPPAEIFAAASDEVGALFGTGLAGVQRFEEARQSIVFVGVSKDVESAIPVGTSWPLHQGLASEEVYRTGRSARADLVDWSRVDGPVGPAGDQLGVVSMVASPIIVEGRLWGTATVSARERLPENAEERLQKFAELLATAIANTESREKRAILTEEQAALRRVATLVAEESFLADVLAGVAEEVGRVLGGVEWALTRDDRDGMASVLAVSDGNPTPAGSRVPVNAGTAFGRAIIEGKPARIDDYFAEPGDFARVAREHDIHAAVSCPIVVHGGTWGAMSVGWRNPEPLPAGTEALIERFSDLIATAIGNAEARGEVERLAHEQAALRRVATLVALGVEPEGVFRAVADEVSTLFGSEIGAIVRFEDDGTATVLGDVGGPHEPGARVRLDPGYVVHTVSKTGRSARYDTDDPSAASAGSLVRSTGVRSAVASPIVVEGKLWGAVTAGSLDGPMASGAERRLAEFTELVAVAVANTQARGQLTTIADEQAALRRVATLVADQADPSIIFATVAEEVAHSIAADRCAIGRYEGADVLRVVAYWSDHEPKVPAGTPIDVGADEVVAAVRTSSGPLRIDDHEAYSGPLMDYARTLGALPTTTIAAPVFVGRHLWGTIFTSTMAAEPFPEGAESRVMSFAELVATAIANADSREALAGLADEQAALRRVATLVAQGVQPSEIFAAVSREVEGVVGARMDASVTATVVRFDPGQESVLVGASKTIEGTPLGMRWPPHELFVSTRVLRTGEPARVEETEVLPVKGPDAEKLRRQGYLCQVATPIVVEGRLWGAMTLSATETLPAHTEERLESFTELVATAIANAENKSALAASRRRIVAASDETRRRIERDLHDGTQQRLVSLGLAVRAAEAEIPMEHGDLREELSRVATGLADAVEDLQELSRGIHPAILSKGGLGPALRELALRSPITVELKVATDTRLPESIEVAAYFVASEALANAAKHSQASRIQLLLAVRRRILTLSIRDDGVGGAHVGRGSGLIGLADRVEALGGSIEVQSAEGEGTRVTAKLPLDTTA